METSLLVLGGVIISLVVGTLWYMPNTPTGKIHMRYIGFDKLTPEEQKAKIEQVKPTMWKIYLGQMILSLLTVVATVFIVSMSLQNGVSVGMALLFPLVNWLCFYVPAVGSNILWGNCESSIAWPKFFSDIGCVLVTILIVGSMTAFFA